MAAPRYFQTEDEKQMAAIRANNSAPGVYENGKRLDLSDDRAPGVYENGKNVRPYQKPAPKWQQDITKKYPRIGKPGTPENEGYVFNYKNEMASKRPFDTMELADDVMDMHRGQRGTASHLRPHQGPAPKWQQDITKKYPGIGMAGTPENEAYVAEYKDRMSSKKPFDTMELADATQGPPRMPIAEQYGPPMPTEDAWQRGLFQPLIAKTDPYGTALNDRPGRGRSFENLSRPMGTGTLSQRPTSTAPGASERVAARRAIIMNPKSTEVARRFAKGIGGARNNDSWAP